MDTFVFFACAGCMLFSPVFLAMSLFAGTVPAAYFLLRPYTRSIQPWGMPRLSLVRLVSLLIMIAFLVPLAIIGSREYSTLRVVLCLAGLAACCGYLWFRACWLLDAHHVHAPSKALLFPGLLSPAILLSGTSLGGWALALVLVAPFWPVTIVMQTFTSAIVGVPAGLLVVAGLRYTFSGIEVGHGGIHVATGCEQGKQGQPGGGLSDG